jgi:trehalose 6-phosphate synthase
VTEQVLVGSNRGPISFREVNGALEPSRGAGGLVTALMGAVQETEGIWVASAMDEADRKKAAEGPGGRIRVAFEDAKFDLRLLSFDEETYDRFYNTISNRLLWFLHHYLWDVPRWPRFGARSRESWGAYREVNERFAEALAEDAAGRTVPVLVQDYHLSLVPGFLREMAPQARVVYFHHVPFAGPGYMRLVPLWLRDEMMDGLLGADIVGFHTRRWADEFLFSARMLPGATVSIRRRTVQWRGRTVRVGVYPISVDPQALLEQARSEEVTEERERLRSWLGDRRLLLRVDRMELSKNVLRGFLAYEEFLHEHPEWRERVVFLAHLNPSRESVEDYRIYTEQCVQTAERINRELGTSSWTPIEVDMGDNFPRVLAAYSLYDVLLVNPVFDGMNLVAREGPLLNRNDGTLVLSRNAGASEILGDGPIPIDPMDIAGTAAAVRHGLEMQREERRRRAGELRRAAESRTPADWVDEQLADLRAQHSDRRG